MKRAKITHPLSVVLSALFLILLGAPAGWAQTQAQMNIAAGRKADRADAAMNAAYKKLLLVLNPAQEAHLRQAQRAWLVYRDNEAALSASVSEGGTMFPALYSSEVEELTENRTRELKQDYELMKR